MPWNSFTPYKLAPQKSKTDSGALFFRRRRKGSPGWPCFGEKSPNLSFYNKGVAVGMDDLYLRRQEERKRTYLEEGNGGITCSCMRYLNLLVVEELEGNEDIKCSCIRYLNLLVVVEFEII